MFRSSVFDLACYDTVEQIILKREQFLLVLAKKLEQIRYEQSWVALPTPLTHFEEQEEEKVPWE